MKSVVEISHDFLKPALHKQAVCLDATMGNGKDTRFFLNQGVRKVIAFEIQQDIFEKTFHEINALSDNVFFGFFGFDDGCIVLAVRTTRHIIIRPRLKAKRHFLPTHQHAMEQQDNRK